MFKWLVRLAESLDRVATAAPVVEIIPPEPGPGLSLHCGHTVPLADCRIGDDGLTVCSRCKKGEK